MLDLTSDDSQKPKSDQVLDFSHQYATTPTPLREKTELDQLTKSARGTRCAVCSSIFSSISDLNKHFANFHIDVLYEKTFSRGGDEGDGTIPCIICGSAYLQQAEILQHYEKNHPNLLNPYKKRASPGALFSDFMAEPPSKKAKDTLQCFQCGFIARDLGELDKHRLVHSLNRPYSCTICGYSTELREDLNKHMTKYHNVEEIQSKLMSGELFASLRLRCFLFH